MKVALASRMEMRMRLSGLDLARGLMRSGYRLKGNAGGHLLLERGSRAVTVPFVDELEPGLLRYLTLAAGVLPQQLLAVLQAPTPRACTAAAGSSAENSSAAAAPPRADVVDSARCTERPPTRPWLRPRVNLARAV
jgi:hypothetical protein